MSTDRIRATIDLGIGYRPRDNNRYIDGRLADVRIYDHALTAGDVRYLASAPQRATLTTGWKVA